MRIKDYTGMKIGKLTAIRRTERKAASKAYIWEFRCECGGTTEATMSDVRSGHTKSCGCLQRQRAAEIKTIHGMEGTRLYRTWSNMKTRCTNSNVKAYKNYGEKGINVCQEWQDFNNFMQWALSSGYDKGLQIDRINNNLGYSPDNCRWVTPKQQQQNRSNTRVVKIGNFNFTVRELSQITGISYSILSNRRSRNQALLTKDQYDHICKSYEGVKK